MAPRKRLRDWPQLVFKFAAFPDTAVDGQLPQQMWDQARADQLLWNWLANEHEFVRWSIREDTPEEERKDRWALFEAEAKYQFEQSGLNWECDILDRFRKACVSAAKQKSRGWPRPRRLSVSILHRFTQGGLPAIKLANKRNKRIAFSDTLSHSARGHRDPNRIRRFSFGLDNDQAIAGVAVIHTPIPEGAVVKSVRWVGNRSAALGWSWWLVIQVEVQPTPRAVMTGKKAAIDVGWRKLDNALRVGYLVDSDGRQRELTLPLDFANHSSRRHHRRYPDSRKIPENHVDLRALSSQRGLMLEELKTRLRALLPTMPPGFDRMRDRGLTNLMHDYEADHPVAQAIQDWLTADLPLFRTESLARQRFVSRRAWVYGNLAADIARQYDEIAVEDLNIKRMIEDDDRDYSLKAADYYHQIAATSDFIQILQRACKKYGAVCVKKKANYSTTTCSTCGSEIEPGPELVRTCANGHSMDQDENAARNLLSATWELAEV